MHFTREPSILYFGTPVVLISTVNEDGSANLAPMSSVFWLGWRGMLGLERSSKTPQNMLRNRECVLNLPSSEQVAAVDRLALTTGANPVPKAKRARGYRHAKDKFSVSGLTPDTPEVVSPPRVAECPVQLEAVVAHVRGLGEDDPELPTTALVFEIRVLRVHLQESILMPGRRDHVDPDRWRPLIMNFQKFYGLAPDQLQTSTLATVPERMYKSPDVDRARLNEVIGSREPDGRFAEPHGFDHKNRSDAARSMDLSSKHRES